MKNYLSDNSEDLIEWAKLQINKDDICNITIESGNLCLSINTSLKRCLIEISMTNKDSFVYNSAVCRIQKIKNKIETI